LHPASNIIADVFDATKRNIDDYTVEEIVVNSLDNILEEYGVDRVDLLSVTTNGSEAEILAGLNRCFRRVRYISIIADANKLPWLTEHGFECLGEDDRGFLFVNREYADDSR
jgi:hypothetical protein